MGGHGWPCMNGYGQPRPMATTMAMTNIIDELNQEQLKSNIPEFGPGDTVVVQVRVKEGDRERLQAAVGDFRMAGPPSGDAQRSDHRTDRSHLVQLPLVQAAERRALPR